MATLQNVQLDHCSFIVPDLDAAVGFFTEWMGFDLVSEYGPIQSDFDDRITRQYAMPERAVGRGALLGRSGNQIELREWKVYGQGLNPLRESTVPGCSIALQIKDLEKSLEQLKKIPRMRILEIDEEAGFVYCFTPFGILLKLLREEGGDMTI